MTIDVPGATLHVLDEGPSDRPAIVLLHAGIADSRAWDALAPILADAGYRVVRYDRRGFGRTETTEAEFSNRADLVAVLDALAIDRAVLIGNSQGGQIAIDTAIEFPERVAAIVAVAAGLGGFEGDITPAEIEAIEHLDELETALDEAGAAADPADVAAFVEQEIAFWVDGLGQPTDRVPAALRDLMLTMDAEHLAPGREQGRAIPLRPPAAERLEAIHVPVLAVAGALDLSEMTTIAQHLAATVPGATAVIWPDVAHMIGMEFPERLADLILDTLEPLPRW